MSFTSDVFGYLGELRVNNNREWFNDNKQRYEDCVREPALAFVRAMNPHLDAISPHYVASDKKVGGSLMRIFRDVRFSKDKTPYKTNVGIHFKHEAGKDVHAPGFYVHMSPDEVFLGVGMWRPDKDALAAIRAGIAEEPETWLAVRDAADFRSVWDLTGESLSRPPRGYPKDHPMIEDLKRKDHIAGSDMAHSDVLGPEGLEEIARRFALAAGYARHLSALIKLPF